MKGGSNAERCAWLADGLPFVHAAALAAVLGRLLQMLAVHWLLYLAVDARTAALGCCCCARRLAWLAYVIPYAAAVLATAPLTVHSQLHATACVDALFTSLVLAPITAPPRHLTGRSLFSAL